MGSSKWDGTISAYEFSEGAQEFAEKWKKVCQIYNHDLPFWCWVSSHNPILRTSDQVNGYLSLEKMSILKCEKTDEEITGDDAVGEEPNCLESEESNCLESEECTDLATLVQQAVQDIHYYDFHIVYSSSYRIPVLYFRGYTSDGQTLMLDQIERDLPPSSIQALSESKWTFITQQEHPYLNRPWYTLHPCGTNELMSLLLTNTSFSGDKSRPQCYFISWLSVVSQIVGLRIPLQLAT